MLDSAKIAQLLQDVRTRSPLVHNITNYVVMNTTANALLALGASPVMAHAPEEVEDMVGIAGALVVNIGTLSRPWVDSMLGAMRAARTRGIPIVFDPVGVGATAFRNEVAALLMSEATPSIIRGNASEIMALQKAGAKTKGVDSTHASIAALDSATAMAQAHACTVCVSGAVDYVVDAEGVVEIRNGDPLMAKVTGMGCTATALIGAFAAVTDSASVATQAAMAVMGIAGEKAASQAKSPGSFQTAFLDSLYDLGSKDVAARLRLARS